MNLISVELDYVWSWEEFLFEMFLKPFFRTEFLVVEIWQIHFQEFEITVLAELEFREAQVVVVDWGRPNYCFPILNPCTTFAGVGGFGGDCKLSGEKDR